MLTIPVMVRVGPWTLVNLARHPEWTNCERCDTRIKEVWTCVVDATATKALERLDGKPEWLVGSTCGPTLLEVSDAVWKQQTSSTLRRMNLLARVEALLERAEAEAVELPKVIRERRTLLLSGEATDKQVRHLGLVVGRWAKTLDKPGPS